MALVIDDPQTERMAQRNEARFYADIEEIVQSAAKLPAYERRSVDDILGYDENGIPM